MSNRRQQAALQDMGYLPSAGGGLIVRLPKLVSDPDFQVVPVPPVAELLPVFLAVKQLWHWTSANPPFPVSGASSARREILGAAPKKGAGRMNINDILTSRFVRAYDLQGKEPVVTIARVELVAMGKTRERKLVLFFVGKEKGLRLNPTMLRAIAAIAGSEETDRWTGTVVQLYTTTATFANKIFPVVRVKAPTRAPVLVKAGGTR